MAERRMFAKSIISSARFLQMPPSSRLLYYDLGMFADDEGVVEAFTVMRQTNATEDDLRVLVSKGFVKILNDELVSVIMDWNENNYIRADRLKPSRYRALLVNLADTCQSDVRQLADNCPSNVSIGKDRVGEDRVGEDRVGEIYSAEIQEIVSYLNEMTGQHYRPETKETRKHIKARLAEGFTVDDFKTVIYKKTKEWKDDAKMVKFLRPQTLFGTKFEAYLNQVEVNAKNKYEQFYDQMDEWALEGDEK